VHLEANKLMVDLESQWNYE